MREILTLLHANNKRADQPARERLCDSLSGKYIGYGRGSVNEVFLSRSIIAFV